MSSVNSSDYFFNSAIITLIPSKIFLQLFRFTNFLPAVFETHFWRVMKFNIKRQKRWEAEGMRVSSDFIFSPQTEPE